MQTESGLVDTTESKAEYFLSAPEIIGHIGFFPVTNTLFTSLLITVFLSIIAFSISKKLSMVPGKLQAFMEIIIEYIFKLTEQIAGSKAPVFFPWLMTFVLFILTANLSGLLPGFSSIGIYKIIDGTKTFIPFFHSINADLNSTLALAFISLFITHFFAIRFLGIKAYLQKWFSTKMFGIALFVGMLELVSEFTKIISLSFRLYGNIQAGKVMLKTAKSFYPFVLPLPFYIMEIMVAFIQTAVFMMLTLVFMRILSSKQIH